MSAERRGLMFVLSSPSGAGKSTIARKLLDVETNMRLSISVTTRERRKSEIRDVDYHFITSERFAAMKAGGELLEWALVHGNYYGTPRAPVASALDEGRDVLFDIDWQGTRQLKAAMGSDVVGVFILPPSMAELRARLERRAEDAREVIDRRLANARTEIEHWSEYDYVLVNRDLQESFDAARAILDAERGRRERPPRPSAVADRYRRERQPELAGFVADLVKGTA
ncbi:MAG TPA: guanylate kinase [Bauldia sp.]|nr:guanylate kinase [Bauldia sp.]